MTKPVEISDEELDRRRRVLYAALARWRNEKGNFCEHGDRYWCPECGQAPPTARELGIFNLDEKKGRR